MFVDVFECFKKSNNEISDAINTSYPENKLNTVNGAYSLNRIEGVAKSLRFLMESKYGNIEQAEKEEKFRSVFSSFTPSDEQAEMKDVEEELGYVVDWDSILLAYPKAIERTVSYYKKNGDAAMHAALQAIQGKVEVMNLLLNAIKVSS